MLGWQTGPPRGMEIFSMGKIKEWFVKGKSKRFNNKSSSSKKGSFKLKKKRSDSDSKNFEDPDKDKILFTKDEKIEDGEIIEELEEGHILETQETEKGPSSGIISNQVQDEQEQKPLRWYFEKAIQQNEEWATSDPKECSEWVKKALPPSSEYEE
ncbi:hypothetical protein O181_037735 [Austropuccinia psidii MF-1]|uniref:Uncharacterized protein n=1 Tax=Austropuccinia psidii MF-1 TaxID=1389203 RepID=A0A9Q3DBJ7_9BASI|nr:hypothetical protein [Austropuccinia psidii MF-1]